MSWDKSHLVMTFSYGALLGVLIFEDFCVYIHERSWATFDFLVLNLALVSGQYQPHRTSWEMFPP